MINFVCLVGKYCGNIKTYNANKKLYWFEIITNIDDRENHYIRCVCDEYAYYKIKELEKDTILVIQGKIKQSWQTKNNYIYIDKYNILFIPNINKINDIEKYIKNMEGNIYV